MTKPCLAPELLFFLEMESLLRGNQKWARGAFPLLVERERERRQKKERQRVREKHVKIEREIPFLLNLRLTFLGIHGPGMSIHIFFGYAVFH